MPEAKLDVSDTGVRISDLEIHSKDVADYLRVLPQDERPASLARAIEVGVFCMERARSGQSLDFVKQQVDSLLHRIERALDKIPTETQRQLVEKIGTSEGQVLAPV
jgi:hypothetical protein